MISPDFPTGIIPCDGLRNFLTFANTAATGIAYERKISRSLKILVGYNSSRLRKRQKITSKVRDIKSGEFANRILVDWYRVLILE